MRTPVVRLTYSYHNIAVAVDNAGDADAEADFVLRTGHVLAATDDEVKEKRFSSFIRDSKLSFLSS